MIPQRQWRLIGRERWLYVDGRYGALVRRCRHAWAEGPYVWGVGVMSGQGLRLEDGALRHRAGEFQWVASEYAQSPRLAREGVIRAIDACGICAEVGQFSVQTDSRRDGGAAQDAY